MGLFEQIKEKEYSSMGFKNQRRNLKYSEHQTGKTNKIRDEERHALLPGKRMSKTGHIYWESRASRSDMKDSKV